MFLEFTFYFITRRRFADIHSGRLAGSPRRCQHGPACKPFFNRSDARRRRSVWTVEEKKAPQERKTDPSDEEKKKKGTERGARESLMNLTSRCSWVTWPLPRPPAPRVHASSCSSPLLCTRPHRRPFFLSAFFSRQKVFLSFHALLRVFDLSVQ